MHATLERGQPAPAKRGRSARILAFDYNARWRGRLYEQKRVEVVFVLEDADTIVITVYGFYGKWSA